MKKTLFLSLLSLLTGFAPVEGQMIKGQEPKIFVNNRVLANVNGKPITTYDLVKKMDMTFYKYYPEYAGSNGARFQFYQEAWKQILDDLITEELILADAKEGKVDVSAGDVRQEIEAEFGPNVIENLDKAGMTLEEASKVMQSDLIIQKMIAMKANSKALRQVTPSVIRKAYEEYTLNPENRNLTVWTYRVVTFKDRNIQKTEELAKNAYALLIQGVPLNDLVATLKSKQQLGRRGKVTISNEIKNNEKEASADYKKILVTMETGKYSSPFPYKSRAERTTVYRIIYVQEKNPGGFPGFKELEPKIKQKLLTEASEKETDQYINRLRDHYHVRESDVKALLPADYQPFVLN